MLEKMVFFLDVEVEKSGELGIDKDRMSTLVSSILNAYFDRMPRGVKKEYFGEDLSLHAEVRHYPDI